LLVRAHLGFMRPLRRLPGRPVGRKYVRK
jgi:hypothetical protein